MLKLSKGTVTHLPYVTVFSWGDWGPPIQRKLCQSPPSDTCPRFWTKACPPPAEVSPRKSEKFKYILVSNSTTFKHKSTLKSCISPRGIEWLTVVLWGWISQTTLSSGRLFQIWLVAREWNVLVPAIIVSWEKAKMAALVRRFVLRLVATVSRYIWDGC